MDHVTTKHSSLKKNFIYSFCYQLLNLIFPLITVPFVARALGSEGVGVYAYTSSIVYFFTLISMLGIENYGNRAIASSRDNKQNLSKTFTSIYIVHLTMSILAVLLYGLFCLYFVKNNMTIYLIQLVYLISFAFDINWFFFGLEKFKLTVTRNLVIKILTLTSILVLVKGENSLVIYVLIMALSSLFTQLFLWPHLRKYINIKSVKLADCLPHIKPLLVLLIPVIAVTIYQSLDRIMLGNMVNLSNVGLYDIANRVITVPLGLITALGIVMLPRMSNLLANNGHEEAKAYIVKSMMFVVFLAVPITFGLMATAHIFVPLFFGDNFSKSATLIVVMAPSLLFISWANVIRTQHLIPNNMDRKYVTSIFLGAVVNVVLNMLLIPKYTSVGASIAILSTEIAVMLYQTIIVRKYLDIKLYAKSIFPFFSKGIIMFGSILYIGTFSIGRLPILITQIIAGSVIYGFLNLGYIRMIVYAK